MSDIKNKISNALYILENKREEFSNEKFLEYCKVVKRNIMKAFEEGDLTKEEAKPLLKRVNKLLYSSKKEFYKKETEKGIEKEIEKISLGLDLKKEEIKSGAMEFKDSTANSIEEALKPSESIARDAIVWGILFGIVGFGIGYLIFGRIGGEFIPLDELFSKPQNEWEEVARWLAGFHQIRNNIIFSSAIGAFIGVVFAILRGKNKG